MILRGVGLSLLVGAILTAPSVPSAAPALVFEPYKGTVLYAEDPDALWFDAKVVCSQKARTQAPSKLDLPVGGAITLDLALKVLIVKSANDVAVMIAETVAGSEQAFVARMNKAAQNLGMTRTNFTNVNGLPDERQVTSARDLAKLARANVSIYVGPKAPKGLESNWIPTAGKRPLPAIRFYGPTEAFNNKTFKLPDFKLVS